MITKSALLQGLGNIVVYHDFSSDNYFFTYSYQTEDKGIVRIAYTISNYWVDFSEGDLSIEPDEKLEEKLEFRSNGVSSRPDPENKLKQYATLFYRKTEEYFKKTNWVMIGDSITTKIIRMTADNLNQKEQIVLNKSALLSCELDDLLK